MKLYCKGGIVIATHADDQNVSPEAYGEGTIILHVPDGTSVQIGSAAPVLDFAAAKALKLGALSRKVASIIADGYRHNFGSTAGIRTLSLSDVRDETAWLTTKFRAQDLTSSGDGDTPMKLRDQKRETFSTSATVADQAMSDMAEWRQGLAEHAWTIEDAIAAAPDPTALEAIDIEAGWPE